MWGRDVRKNDRMDEVRAHSDGTPKKKTWGGQTAQHRRIHTTGSAQSPVQRTAAAARKLRRKRK